MYWGHFHPFGFILFLLIAGFLITNFIILKRNRRGICTHTPYDALTILENRLAKGEIGIEEYQELKNTLKR
jgi:uncharacterized membrane protein